MKTVQFVQKFQYQLLLCLGRILGHKFQAGNGRQHEPESYTSLKDHKFTKDFPLFAQYYPYTSHLLRVPFIYKHTYSTRPAV